MANYVEYIKVGSGESWAVRDVEARQSIASINTTIEQHAADVENLNSNMNTVQDDITVLTSDVQTATERANAALPATGGTMTGPLVLTEGEHYGDELPEPGTVGRIFFKKVSS